MFQNKTKEKTTAILRYQKLPTLLPYVLVFFSIFKNNMPLLKQNETKNGRKYDNDKMYLKNIE